MGKYDDDFLGGFPCVLRIGFHFLEVGLRSRQFNGMDCNNADLHCLPWD